MAKRFISTTMFDDSWFMKLKPNTKLVFIYFITNCDHAGIIDFNVELAEFKTKIKGLANSWPTVAKEFSNHLVTLRDNYYFMPSFVKFQYPKGLNINVKAQMSVINRLKEFDLFDEENKTVIKGLSNSYLTVQDKDKDIVIDKIDDIYTNWDNNRLWEEITKSNDNKAKKDSKGYSPQYLEWFYLDMIQPTKKGKLKFQERDTFSVGGLLANYATQGYFNGNPYAE